MRLYATAATERGIRERRQRKLMGAAPEPAQARVDNVVRFRRPPIVREILRMPTAADFSRAKHMAFLKSTNIAINTPMTILIGRVAAWHGFTAEQMIEPCRKRSRVEARADCIAAVKRAYPKTSMPRLGQIFGDRDHTTILHYLRKRGW